MDEILVVRQFDNFCRILTRNGLTVVNCPTIETAECGNSHNLGGKISPLSYDGIFLTSPKAAEIAWRELFSKKKYRGRVYVLGQRSFEILKDKDLLLYFDETANTAREMLERIPPDELTGKRFLFIRGEKTVGTISEVLRKIAELDEEIVYETRKVTVEVGLKKEIETKIRDGQIKAACFFSPSGAESFFEQFDKELLHRTKIAVIGKTTADFFERQNLNADFIARKATAEDFAIELIDYLNTDAEARA